MKPDEAMELLQRIDRFLRQCSPHHRERDWHKLLTEARALLTQSKAAPVWKPYVMGFDSPPASAAPATNQCSTNEPSMLRRDDHGLYDAAPASGEGMPEEPKSKDYPLLDDWLRAIHIERKALRSYALSLREQREGMVPHKLAHDLDEALCGFLNDDKPFDEANAAVDAFHAWQDRVWLAAAPSAGRREER
jgi:hypothetical protein